MSKAKLINSAKEMFLKKNCAQSVFVSCAEHFGLGNDTYDFISAPFGGGLCGTRVSVCGAVSGGLMFVGLMEKKNPNATDTGQELIKFVEGKYGHRCCEKILDIDFSDAEQVEREKAKKGKTICTPLIADVCGWLHDRYAEEGE